MLSDLEVLAANALGSRTSKRSEGCIAAAGCCRGCRATRCRGGGGCGRARARKLQPCCSALSAQAAGVFAAARCNNARPSKAGEEIATCATRKCECQPTELYHAWAGGESNFRIVTAFRVNSTALAEVNAKGICRGPAVAEYTHSRLQAAATPGKWPYAWC